MSKGKIRVASCQFAESFNPRRNAAVVLRYMAKAKARRAELVHIHEAALTGYLARKDAPPLDDDAWAALREATESICAAAKRSMNHWRRKFETEGTNTSTSASMTKRMVSSSSLADSPGT